MTAKKKATKNVVTLSVHATVVAIDADFEPITAAPSAYRQQKVYPFMEQQGFKIVRCRGPLARRVDVAPQVVKPGVIYLTGVGHGFPSSYTGDNFDPIFTEGSYSPQEVRGKVVHFFSCQTAGQLGPDFVKNGCLAYFGYSENFSYQPDFADLFFECDSEIDRAFAEGLTADEVYRRVIALFNQHIAQLKATGDNGDLFKASILETDRDLLRAPSLGTQFGDPQARIV